MNYRKFCSAFVAVGMAFSQVSVAEIKVSNPELPEEPERVDNANGVVATDVTFYDDTRYPDQVYWDSLTDTYQGRSEIEPVHEAFDGFSKTPVRVAVIDGGFYDSPDLDWAGGINMVDATYEPDIEVGDDFRQYDPDNCDNTHGQGVASVIAANADNNFLHAGIADPILYGIRALDCSNGGTLQTVTESIYWATEHSSHEDQGYPTIDEPVDVINISISGDSDQCPTHLQDAIDYANDQGTTIVVAAGNEEKDASEVSPANCDGVITVASANEFGNQSSFTNFGSPVDIAAQGEEVVGENGKDGEDFYSAKWSGTSFSSPIVAGIIAYTRSLTGHDSPQTDRDLINASATQLGSSSDPIGPGILNAPLMAENAFDPATSGSITAKQVLASESRCNNALFTQHSPVSIPACELYEIDYGDESVTIPDGYEMMVFKGNDSNPLKAEDDNLVKASSEKNFVFQIPDDAEGDYYATQVCKSDLRECEGSMESLPVDKSIDCKEASSSSAARQRTDAQ